MLTPKLRMLQRTLVRLMRRGAAQQLGRVVGKTRPEDLAYLLAHFSEAERSQLFDACPSDGMRTRVVACADTETAAALIATVDASRAVDLLQAIEPDDASDILQQLPDDLAEELLRRMRGLERDEVEDLSRYDSNSAGGIMSPRFFALHRDTTARQAIEHLQRVSDELEMVFYVYVVNEVEQLLGVVSLRQLVTTKGDTTLLDLMTSDLITVSPDEDQEEVAKLASRYGLLAVPVVGDSNRLLGIVTVDDVIDVLQEEATEDILRMAGAGHELPAKPSVLRAVGRRFPWVLAVSVGGTASAFLLMEFRASVMGAWPLLFLTPLVLGLSGISALQSATIITQYMAQGLMGAKLVVQVLGQGAAAAVNGLFFGAVGSLLCWVMLSVGISHGGGYMVHLALLYVGVGVAVSMAVAATVGGIFPVLFSRIGADPAIVAGPVGAAAAEVVALALFLFLGSWGFTL